MKTRLKQSVWTVCQEPLPKNSTSRKSTAERAKTNVKWRPLYFLVLKGAGTRKYNGGVYIVHVHYPGAPLAIGRDQSSTNLEGTPRPKTHYPKTSKP